MWYPISCRATQREGGGSKNPCRHMRYKAEVENEAGDGGQEGLEEQGEQTKIVCPEGTRLGA